MNKDNSSKQENMKRAASNDNFEQHYNDDSFWLKIKQFAIKVGKEAIEKSLIMYYCMKDRDTPAKHKSVILSALGYFIMPIDLIPDILPGGWADDLGALALAFSMVTNSIKQEHIEMANHKVIKLFSKGNTN